MYTCTSFQPPSCSSREPHTFPPKAPGQNSWIKEVKLSNPLCLAESSYATHERSWWIWWICEKHISNCLTSKRCTVKGSWRSWMFLLGWILFARQIELKSSSKMSMKTDLYNVFFDYINHVCMQIYIIYIIYIIHVYFCTINLYCTMNHLHESVIDHSQVINMSKLV